MELTLSLNSIVALFTSMAILAAVPSVSVMAVSARSASCGFGHGALTAAGVVLGDIIFILLVLFGLAMLAATLDAAFVWVEYAGGAYLLWLSYLVWRSRPRPISPKKADSTSALSSFMTGLLITLADQKAVLFYFGFLPSFVHLATLTAGDVLVITAIAIIAVGGVKLAYAGVALKATQVLGGNFSQAMNMLAACIMLTAGLWVITRA